MEGFSVTVEDDAADAGHVSVVVVTAGATGRLVAVTSTTADVTTSTAPAAKDANRRTRATYVGDDEVLTRPVSTARLGAVGRGGGSRDE
jgi:hypothetical protein